MALEAPTRRSPVGTRGLVLIGILAAGLAAAVHLDLFAAGSGLPGGAAGMGEFLSRALSPSLVSEAPPPFGGSSLRPDLLRGVVNTVFFAAAALGLALAGGFLLGFLGSTAWWSGERRGPVRGAVAPAIYGATRVLIALLRSVHELIWAVLFLCALGRSDLAAVVALALPYSGTVAKVFSEMIDEAPRDAALALRAAGAGPVSVFAWGLLPRALPDLTAYSFYQFECLLRSAAVLGFFGFPTLGYFLAASFENLYWGEVWTWLYALLALVLAAELWSAAIRARYRS